MKYCVDSRRKVIFYIQCNERRLTGLITSCVGFCLLKHVIEGKVEGRTEMLEYEE
jgi:hypothetical protein